MAEWGMSGMMNERLVVPAGIRKGYFEIAHQSQMVDHFRLADSPKVAPISQ
jgi:hypothetical protein